MISDVVRKNWHEQGAALKAKPGSVLLGSKDFDDRYEIAVLNLNPLSLCLLRATLSGWEPIRLHSFLGKSPAEWQAQLQQKAE